MERVLIFISRSFRGGRLWSRGSGKRKEGGIGKKGEKSKLPIEACGGSMLFFSSRALFPVRLEHKRSNSYLQAVSGRAHEHASAGDEARKRP